MGDEAWKLSKRSGLKRVMIGLESGSQTMLDWMKKDIKLEQVFDCARRCIEHDIAALFNIIVGFPGEPFSSVQDSFAAARRLRAMSPKFEVPIFYYWPYPGNEIAESLARDGYQFPSTLQAWANFDFVGGAGPWVDEAKYRLVERFKFYQKHGYGPSPHLAR